ncbi:hypothetical protein ACFYO1_29575 [Nocardia sp. NPDC006044]|uniref:hypothetical protein n=1 Tax=Nocardia sp. NPDC006044 TaxID=3364306 RepID=UPI0036A14D4A
MDFDHCVTAEWIAPAQHVAKDIAGTRKTVSVPLFSLGDVEDLLQIPLVDWDAVRAAPPGGTSPLAQFAAHRANRAVAVRRFIEHAARRYGIELAAAYMSRSDQWVIRWENDVDETLDQDVLAHDLASDPDAAAFVDSIVLETGSIESPRFTWGIRHRATPAPSPRSDAPTWGELRAKLLDRLGRPGTAPSLKCRDAHTFVEKLEECGVKPMRLGSEQSWQSQTRMGPVDLDVPDEIALLAGKLKDSVEHRFAPNLTKREAKMLLDYIAATERRQRDPGDPADQAVS